MRIHASADRSAAELEFVYDAEIVQVVRALRQRIREYVVGFVDRGVSMGYHGQLVAAVRFFCEHVLHDRSLGCAWTSWSGCALAISTPIVA